MKPVRRPARLSLERLEARDCPSLTVTLFGGSLLVRGAPAGVFSLTEPSPGRLTVSDNGHSLGTYAVTGDLFLSLTSHPHTVTVDFGGNTFPGNVLVSLGNGGQAIHPVSVQNGTVGGNVTFLGGSGEEAEDIGGTLSSPGPLAVRGAVQAVGKASGSGLIGNSFFVVGTGSSVGGDVSITRIANVGVGLPFLPLTTVGGNLTINDAGSGTPLLVNLFGDVGKSVSVTGTNPADSFILGPTGPGVGGNVLGNMFLDLGDAGGAGLQAGSTVGGSATLSTHGVAPTVGPPGGFTVAGTVNGSLTVNLGDAPNSLAYGATASVGGNLSVTGGGGNDTVAIAGTVGGGLSFQFGNGSDSVTVSSAPGGPLRWASGNGNTVLTLAPTAAGSSWNVSVRFGSGDDSFTLAGAGGFISGLVDGGGGSNVFTQGAGWVIVPPWTLQNF
jgi:hypothetical protein